jgi:molecular chaperone DnaK (HSP70)
MPSLVGYADDGAIVVGEDAADTPAEQVVRSIKRAITSRRDFVRLDTPAGVQTVRTDELIVELLREVVRRGRDAGQDMTGNRPVWLGCAAMWDRDQRLRLLECARQADLPLRLSNLVDEPVAAGIAWLADGHVATPGPLRVLVFDMGGGTLDIAVLDVRGTDHRDVSVLAALGVADAGDVLDEAIGEDLEFVLAVNGVDVDTLRDPRRVRERLVDAGREAKIALTFAPEHVIVAPRQMFGVNETTYPYPRETTYTREQLNAVFAAQMDRAEEFLVSALRAARITEPVIASAHDIARTPVEDLVAGVDVVVLSGGMSQIPYVEQRLRKLFPARTRIERASNPPENAVALGLAKAGQYGRINMYRPAFDVFVDWNHRSEGRTIYEAYTPLVEERQIVEGLSDLRFVRTGGQLDVPSRTKARLRVVSHSGAQVHASLDGSSLDGFPVALGQEFEFSIYPNGRIRMIDEAGPHHGQVEDWFTIQEP